jgi:hypothetical protein
VSNPSNGQIPWVVGQLYTTTVSAGTTNHWGNDYVGAPRATVDVVRRDGPSNGITLPCTANIYQDLWIECDASTNYTYETNNALTITINNASVTNCRRAVLDSTNRCETINYQ